MLTVRTFKSYFREKIWEDDLAKMGGPRAFLVKSLRFFILTVREALSNDLSMRAMSLVYIAILSFVPFLAVSFSVAKALGFHVRVQIFIYYFLEPLGEKGVDITMKIIEFVENVNAGILGSIGLLILIYTVISQVQKIERALNAVWNVQGTRGVLQRFISYLGVMFVGPLLLAVAIVIAASVEGTAIFRQLRMMEPFRTVFLAGSRILPYILISVAFTFIYKFLPNTAVQYKPAFAGGCFAGIAWVTAGWIFTSFVLTSAQYSAIYSGFAVIIFFLIWLYWGFLILLVGARISFFVQYPNFMRVRRKDFCLSGKHKERLALFVMYLIGKNYLEHKEPWTVRGLGEHIGLPAGILHGIFTALERGNLIISNGETPPGYLQGRDIGLITIKDILDAVRDDDETAQSFNGTYRSSPEIDAVIKEIEEASGELFRQKTLKQLVTVR